MNAMERTTKKTETLILRRISSSCSIESQGHNPQISSNFQRGPKKILYQSFSIWKGTWVNENGRNESFSLTNSIRDKSWNIYLSEHNSLAWTDAKIQDL